MVLAADLHGHTLFSDARATPEDFVRARKRRGLEVIAISDHDVFGGVFRGAAAARSEGLLFVPATECTATIHADRPEEEPIHVLAYFPLQSLEDGRLERSFLFQRARRVEAGWKSFVLGWMDELGEADRVRLDPDGALAAAAPEVFPSFQLMLEQAARASPALGDGLGRRLGRFWTDRELFGWTPEEAMEAIRGDGAVDVLAHAARYRNDARLETVMAYASGVEVYTPRHRPERAAGYRAFADRHKKLWTAGADDHQLAPYMLPEQPMLHEAVERILGAALPATVTTSAGCSPTT
jgi:hypothetical protein